MAPRTPSTRRTVRSQSTSSVLGKRSASASFPPTNELTLTPESTPRPKRQRLAKIMEEGNSDEENVPPLPSSEDDVDTPTKARSTQDRNTHQQPSPSEGIATPQRTSRIQIPQTPVTPLNSLAVITPPATPTTARSLHARVRSLLRATCNSSESMSINGREKELEIIKAFLSCFDSGSSNANEPVLYISGSPGTGKTALVHSIHASIASTSKTRFVFVNCMAFNSVSDLWEYLGEELFGPIPKGGRKTKRAYDKDLVTARLECNKSMKCIVILDEVDNLSSNISLQPLIHLSVRLRHTIRLLGIANTHTLSSSSSLLPFALESSAEHIKTIHFAPYTSSQLLSILQTRLELIPQDELKKMLPVSTLTLLTKKVAALTGDVRVLFEVLRGAIDVAVSSSPSSSENGKPADSVSVTPNHILSALKTHSPTSSSFFPTKKASNKTSISETVTKVWNLGLQSRLVLFAILVAFKRVSQSLPLSASSSSSLSSPKKKSPIKRSQSAASMSLASTSSTQSLDAVQLHSFYTSVLDSAGTFTPVSRSEFTDLLGLLEANSLISISSSSTSTGGARAFKRTSSFAGRSKTAGGTGQSVRLQSGVREKELARGLGIDVDVNADAAGGSKRDPDAEVDVKREAIREIWHGEAAKMRRELKARARAMDEADRDVEIGFDDAMED